MSMNFLVSSKGSVPASTSSPSTKFVCTYGICVRIEFTCSETCRTLSIPLLLPDFDLFPRSYQDSTPGRMARHPLRRRRCNRGEERMERLLSAPNLMLRGGAAASIASIVSSKRMPKFGSCQAMKGCLNLVRRKRMSSCNTSKSSG